VLEYVTDGLVEKVSGEIARGQPVQLVHQPLIEAHAKDYVRHTQECLIGLPILRRVAAEGGVRGTEMLLMALLEAFCRPRLATYKIPREFAFTDEIPKNAMGKILKRVLRGQFARPPFSGGG